MAFTDIWGVSGADYVTKHVKSANHMGELSVKKKGRKSIYKLSLEENEDIIASLSSSNAK